MKTHKNSINIFDRLSSKVASISGKPFAFVVACIIVMTWAISGPIFHFSETWQLSINTGTSIITFLMVFVIQQAQNKDTLAIQLKLNELIAATQGASNKVLNIEDLEEAELKALKKFYGKIGELSENEGTPGVVHSFDEIKKDGEKKKMVTHKNVAK
jgi:low affinity Fe/Cu permease